MLQKENGVNQIEREELVINLTVEGCALDLPLPLGGDFSSHYLRKDLKTPTKERRDLIKVKCFYKAKRTLETTCCKIQDKDSLRFCCECWELFLG